MLTAKPKLHTYRTAPIHRLSGAHPDDFALVREKWPSERPA